MTWFQMASPFIIKLQIDYIKTGDYSGASWIPFKDLSDISWLAWLTPDKQYGLLLVCLMIFT